MITDPIEPYPGAWNQTRPANAPAQDDADGRTDPGEGSALDAAIEAAARALHAAIRLDSDPLWEKAGTATRRQCFELAEAAVRAAEPILSQALIAERDDLRRTVKLLTDANRRNHAYAQTVAAERDGLLRKVEAVRALHYEVDTDHGSGMSRCAHDLGWWPCPTIRALDGEEADRG